VIERLVPGSVVVVETDADLLETELSADEERSLGRPVEKRRREFVTGRACARMALERLGVRPTPIVSGERGEPLWPDGVVGSITHCSGLRACAVARAEDLRSVGIDAELNRPLPSGVLEQVASGSERRWATGPNANPDVCMDKLLFSAKESVYKAWFPRTRRPLEFEDVELTVDVRDATFAARLLVAAPDGLRELRGQWSAEGGVLATAVVVPR